MNAFITGSHAYGTPTEDSDVDLVIRCNDATACRLRELSDDPTGAVRFGKLNLVLCTTDEQAAVWRLGTSALRLAEEPADKVQAKSTLDGLREMVCLVDARDSADDEDKIKPEPKTVKKPAPKPKRRKP